MARITVSISWLKLKVTPTQQKPELTRRVLNKADSPLCFRILDAEALGLNSNGSGHRQKMLLANNILTAFLPVRNCRQCRVAGGGCASFPAIISTAFAAVAEWRSSSAIALINKSKPHRDVLICWVMALPGWLNPELRTKLSIGDLPLILTEGRRGVNL